MTISAICLTHKVTFRSIPNINILKKTLPNRGDKQREWSCYSILVFFFCFATMYSPYKIYLEKWKNSSRARPVNFDIWFCIIFGLNIHLDFPNISLFTKMLNLPSFGSSLSSSYTKVFILNIKSRFMKRRAVGLPSVFQSMVCHWLFMVLWFYKP